MHDTGATAIAWTIWTLNEPANYIIAACLPTLRPIFVRILPDRFFILTRKRDTSGNAKTPESPTPDSPRGRFVWSWPKGSMVPKVSLMSRGASRLTGPWDRSRWEHEEAAAARAVKGDEDGKAGAGVIVREKEVDSSC